MKEIIRGYREGIIKGEWVMCKKIEEKIRYLRKHMHNMIEQKENLLDPEIITISQELDILIHQYNQNIHKKL